MGQLAGIAEIMELLGVSRQRVDVLTRRKDFPEPMDTLKTGRVWRTAEVRKWAVDHGREIRDEDPSGEVSPGEDV